MGQRKTINYFQWIRAIGAVSIVMLHALVTVQGALPEGARGPVRFVLEGVLATAGTRWVVPAFFMVSGALMLDPAREMGWDKTLRHAWRLVFVLLTFGFGYCLVESAVNLGLGNPLGIVADALYRLVTGRSWDHMWFIYALLGFYLITPVLRPWVAQASHKELAWVTWATVIMLLATRGLSARLPYSIYNVISMPHYLAYYLLGYYAHTYLELDGRWTALGLISLAAALYLKMGLEWHWVVDPARGVIMPYTLLVFLAFKRFATRPVEDAPSMALLADYSFGIYLVHPVFLHLLALVVDPAALSGLVADALFLLVPLALSLVSAWVLRRIPGFGDKI